MMEFDEWFQTQQEKLIKEYIMMGAFALRTAAKAAWEAGQEELMNMTSEEDIQPEVK